MKVSRWAGAHPSACVQRCLTRYALTTSTQTTGSRPALLLSPVLADPRHPNLHHLRLHLHAYRSMTHSQRRPLGTMVNRCAKPYAGLIRGATVALPLSEMILTSRRGYAIMDKYKRVRPPSEEQGAEGATAKGESQATAQKKKKSRQTIPLQYLRTDPPPEVMGLTDSLMDDEGTEGKLLEVSLLGAPNAGKSSLANALLEAKVSAVSPKAQTTRDKVLGILHDKETNTQVVLSDTPGVVPPRLQKSYGREIAVTGWESLDTANLIMVVVDAARKVDDMTLNIIDRLSKERDYLTAKDYLLVFNKMDLVYPRDKVLPKLEEYTKENIFTETFYVSAIKQTGVDELRKYLISKAVPGKTLFPSDWKTNLSLLERTEEIIREKIFQRTNGDVPYRVSQENIAWYRSKTDGGYIVHQNIIVPNVRLKKILVGEAGRTIKCISMGASEDLEKLCNRKVHLFLEVKVRAPAS